MVAENNVKDENMYPKVTRQTLLDKLKDGDNNAWKEFYEAYRSLVWLKGQDYNLTDAEQQDLLSEVMAAFFTAQGKFTYEPSKGKFGWYFRKVISSFCIKIIKKRLPLEEDDAGQALDEGRNKNSITEIPDTQESEDDEWKALVLRQALQEIKQTMDSRKVQCFMRCRLDDEEPGKVAKSLGISLATAYNYCNEVFNELKYLALQLKRQYE